MAKANHLLILLMLHSSSLLYAQDNAITISSFIVKPKLRANPNEWGSDPGAVVMVAKNNKWGDRPCKLLVALKKGEAKVCGNPEGYALDYFSTRSFQTNDLLQGLNNCETLLQGDYTLCVRFIGLGDAGNWVDISAEVCKPFTVGGDADMQKYERPSLVSPANNKMFTENEANAPITFRWTPVVPKPQEPVMYHLKIWQAAEGQTSIQAINNSQPIFEKEIANLTQMSINSGLWPCRPYCQLIWLVKATNKDGKPFGGNNGESEPGLFTINISPNKDSIYCCKNSSWLNKYYGISAPLIKTRPIPVECGEKYLIDYVADGTITFNADYTCNPANANCSKQVFVQLKNATGNVIAYQPAPYSMPLTNAGNYTVTYYAICGGKTCDSCEYAVALNPDTEKYCCKEGYWINKSVDWNDINSNKTVANTATTTASLSTKITACNASYHLGYIGTYTFNSSYHCALSNCIGAIKVKIKGLTNSGLDGIYTVPVTKTFTVGGNYKITYYAYCGDNLCDSCEFTVGMDQDCCAGSKWVSSNYQIVNKAVDGSWVLQPPVLSFSGNTSPLKADVGIDISNLNYQCAANCTAGFIIKRINAITHTPVYPDETLPAGQTTTSVYSKPFPQMITIIPICGGKACGDSISFSIECLHKNCIRQFCSKDSLVFSTGINLNGSPITGSQQDPYWTSPYGLLALSPGSIPFFGAAGTGGSATLLQNIHYVPSDISFYTIKRDFYICQSGLINFKGKLGISKYDLITWNDLFRSFKIYKAGTLVWTFTPGTPGIVGTYATNDFSGYLNVTPGIYTFIFEYYKASDNWNYNSIFVKGLITGDNIVVNNQDSCCPSAPAFIKENDYDKDTAINNSKLTKADAGKNIFNTDIKDEDIKPLLLPNNKSVLIPAKLASVISNGTQTKEMVLSPFKKILLDNSQPLMFYPDFISIETPDTTLRSFLDKSAVQIAFKIMQSDDGKLYGIPMPVYYAEPDGAAYHDISCYGCKGGKKGGCTTHGTGSSYTVCDTHIGPKNNFIDVVQRTKSNTLTAEYTEESNGIKGKYMRYKYSVKINGKDVLVTIESSVPCKKISFTNPDTGITENHWCGVSTKCGPAFAVNVPDTTPCGRVGVFFNKICDQLLEN